MVKASGEDTSKEDAMTKKTSKKAEAKYVTKPTIVALMSNGKVVVGARRVAASTEKGLKVVDSKKLYWSQIRHVKVAKAKTGKLSLSTEREAAAKGYEVLS